MGHIANLLLALIAVAVADQVGPLWTPQPQFAALLLVVPFLIAPLLRRAVRAGDAVGANRWSTRLRRLPVLAQLVADLGLGWGVALAAARGPTELPPGWPTYWDLLRFLPFVGVTVTSLIANSRAHVHRRQGQRWLRFQLRSFFGAALPFVVLIVADSLLALAPELAWSIHVVELHASLHSLALLLGLAAAVPWLLRHAWESEPLPPGPIRELVEFVAQRADFHCKEVLLWRTGRSMANAMIVGVLPSTRRIFFSDSLLDSLPPRELAAVTAHEIGHAQRGHMALFLMLALGGFGMLSALARTWDPEWPVPFELAVLGLLAPGVLAFRWLSRRFELEADLHACELTQDPSAIGDALLRLGGRLRDVAGWRHFAPSARDAFLQRATSDPDFLAAFERRMRLARVAIIACFVLGFGGSLVAKVGGYELDRYHLALLRGRYALAEQRGADLSELGPLDRSSLQLLSERLGDGTDETREERATRVRELALSRLGADAELSEVIWLLEAAAALDDEQADALIPTLLELLLGEESRVTDLPRDWRINYERRRPRPRD